MVEEELTLFRAKLPGLYTSGATGPGVGPGSYNIAYTSSKPIHGEAPFGITSDRFASHRGAPTPGVGTYDVTFNEAGTGDITMVPFASSVARFYAPRADEVPGPGAYPHDGNRWGKNGRAHTIGTFRFKGTEDAFFLGPGSYNPNYDSGRRAHPRAANFGGYSGRGDPQFSDVPGPGHYDIAASAKSIYDNKPSSMFATKTVRSVFGGKAGTPGPGTYDLPSYFQSLEQYRDANPETFFAFGSSALRYGPYEPTDLPGPGTYTGEIAPRRPKTLPKTKGTSSFASETNRNRLPCGTNLGPGAYELSKPINVRKHQLASVPFRSRLSRFPSPKRTEAGEIVEPYRTLVRVPRRIHPARFLGDTVVTAPKMGSRSVVPDRVYDVKNDWTKPTCTSGSYLGTAPRFEKKALNDFPGPGQYDVLKKDLSNGAKSLNGTWGTDGRFKSGNGGGDPGPGHYRSDSTFYKKSFNCTIGFTEEM
ncbi:hypothetical protein TraAM80_07714 [Trypanosoma rangeli]|uniref:Uncharacterized protein n=1 Tax=Trypanosoma rangeli TaxID=5698 RepID=A0A3R7LN85_TRYRA|nr:uncharacterized protein TraAM80_07714 [Trypanosoma rangeli]RNF00227.1 hypothetical protein TraAM80_07714 [Trypanosoma rangeli]|eukprot:RNF00227.1 hypothetical protein TraAM80_07714 [Trypanosoma rangeli]